MGKCINNNSKFDCTLINIKTVILVNSRCISLTVFHSYVQVIIQGFRSYRDQTVVEPFSPKHNVIGQFTV